MNDNAAVYDEVAGLLAQDPLATIDVDDDDAEEGRPQ
jgi:hypothetical protein